MKQENVIKIDTLILEAVFGTLKLHNCHLSKLKPPDQTSCNLLLLRDLLGAQFSHCATFFPGIPDTMGLNINWSRITIAHLTRYFHEFYFFRFISYWSKKALFFSFEHLKKSKQILCTHHLVVKICRFVFGKFLKHFVSLIKKKITKQLHVWILKCDSKKVLASLCLNEHQSRVFSSLFFELNRPAICKSYTMENQSMKIVLTSTKKGKKDTFGVEMNGRTFLEMTSAYSHHFCGYNWIWKTVEKVHNNGAVQKVRHHFLRGSVHKIEEKVMEDMYKKNLWHGGRGVKNSKKRADVFYGQPHRVKFYLKESSNFNLMFDSF